MASGLVWTGQEMLAMPGGRYDPGGDTWTPISSTGAVGGYPVWTGTEVIVLNTVVGSARYDPNSDVWTPISDVGAPDEWSAGSMALWTGSHVLSLSCSASGGAVDRYDPALDAWTPIEVWDGLGCTRISGVRMGTEVFIFYCSDEPDPDTMGESSYGWGYTYDPVTDALSSVAGAGCPPIDGLQAVWTGNEIILWRYGVELPVALDPSEVPWAAREIDGGPGDILINGTAVWTGTELLVWGADDSGVPTARAGGRYDPASDTWCPMSSTNSPTGFCASVGAPCAIWTGNELVVWTGDPGDSARYSP